ncbi:hypothetical protein AR438_07870 [Chryseobacterium aquaticum]|uniref:Type ISP restriction-modification enzyme LLaBIII C-terminal specificity domain-containing protein n=2 Tax=Chryseobacterium aquaticum TaxID=452084 RepID=A0A0Q3HS68_9FLAO|nr:hypothetical protein AR438_07870 [Chryseobacterium aquaticum]
MLVNKRRNRKRDRKYSRKSLWICSQRKICYRMDYGTLSDHHTHKDSGITNNPNDWSKEIGNSRYILDLLLSVINVSMQTVDIVEGLPKVSFE